MICRETKQAEEGRQKNSVSADLLRLGCGMAQYHDGLPDSGRVTKLDSSFGCRYYRVSNTTPGVSRMHIMADSSKLYAQAPGQSDDLSVIPSTPSRPDSKTKDMDVRVRFLQPAPKMLVPLDAVVHHHTAVCRHPSTPKPINLLPNNTHMTCRDANPSKIPTGRVDSSLPFIALIDCQESR